MDELIPGVTHPFERVIARSAQVERHRLGLKGQEWRIHLAALYLLVGEYIPDLAKREGASFGYCDASGIYTWDGTGTHFGWTPGPAARVL